MPWGAIIGAMVAREDRNSAEKLAKRPKGQHGWTTLGGGFDDIYQLFRDDMLAGYERGPLDFYASPGQSGLGLNRPPPQYRAGRSVEDLDFLRDIAQGSDWMEMARDPMARYLNQGGNDMQSQTFDALMGALGGLQGGGGGGGWGYSGGGAGGGGAGPGREENLAYEYAQNIMKDPMGNDLMTPLIAENQRAAMENLNRGIASNQGQASKFGLGQSSALNAAIADAMQDMGTGLGTANTQAMMDTQGLGLGALSKGGDWRTSRVNQNTASAASRANAAASAGASRYGHQLGAMGNILGIMAGLGNTVGDQGLAAMGMLPGFSDQRFNELAGVYDRQYGSEQDRRRAEMARWQAQQANANREYQHMKDAWEYENYGDFDWINRWLGPLERLSRPYEENWQTEWSGRAPKKGQFGMDTPGSPDFIGSGGGGGSRWSFG